MEGVIIGKEQKGGDEYCRKAGGREKGLFAKWYFKGMLVTMSMAVK